MHGTEPAQCKKVAIFDLKVAVKKKGGRKKGGKKHLWKYPANRPEWLLSGERCQLMEKGVATKV